MRQLSKPIKFTGNTKLQGRQRSPDYSKLNFSSPHNDDLLNVIETKTHHKVRTSLGI